jgi:hypothetical protein
MKPLDIVRTPSGGMGIISAMTSTVNGEATIEFFEGCNPKFERNAWWKERDLIVVDSLPAILCRFSNHFGRFAEEFFPR